MSVPRRIPGMPAGRRNVRPQFAANQSDAGLAAAVPLPRAAEIGCLGLLSRPVGGREGTVEKDKAEGSLGLGVGGGDVTCIGAIDGAVIEDGSTVTENK